jgi:hypothetical protein
LDEFYQGRGGQIDRVRKARAWQVIEDRLSFGGVSR